MTFIVKIQLYYKYNFRTFFSVGKFTNLQLYTKYLQKNKEIKQKWTQAEKFDNYSCVIFECYYKIFSSGRKTGL